ncbi:MAG: hypothetical protein ACRCV0_01465 [Brevinema sp.]
MIFIIFLVSIISLINLYFLVKQRKQKPYNHEIKEFQTQTESIMVEFNRITIRNISMLDEKLEELDHKIRLAQKIDIVLKERLEEMNQISYFSSLNLNKLEEKNSDSLDHKNAHKKTKIKKNKLSESKNPDEIEVKEEIKKDNKNNSDIMIKNNELFEGIPIEKIKKQTPIHLLPTHKKHALLIQYLNEKKTKEELIEIGFSNNEINIATMSLSIDPQKE